MWQATRPASAARPALAALGALALIGCTSLPVPSYTPTPGVAEKIKATTTNYGVELQRTATDDTGATMCRGVGPITTGEGKKYADYIIDALSQDLKVSGAFSPSSANMIKADYNKITFQSSLGASNWYIFGTYTLNGDSVTIDTIYNDKSSFAADKACNNMALYFPKAVAAHLNQLYSSHLFSATNLPAETLDSSLTHRLTELERAHAEGLITVEELERGRRRAIEDI